MAALDIVETLPQAADYVAILPEIVLSVFGMIIMLLDPVMDERRSQRILGGVALLGALAALAATIYQCSYLTAHPEFSGLAFWEMVKVDPFSIFFHVVVAGVTIVALLS